MELIASLVLLVVAAFFRELALWGQAQHASDALRDERLVRQRLYEHHDASSWPHTLNGRND